MVYRLLLYIVNKFLNYTIVSYFMRLDPT